MKQITLSLALAALAMPVFAASDFGTKEEARSIADVVINIVEENGIAAAAQEIVSADGQFRASRMGVNLFQGTVVIADNREPESVAADYVDIQDLTGAPVWGRISAAADIEDDAELLWYHYDTQEEYLFRCFSKRASRDDALVMVCR